jgi:hypothetical protein
MTLTRDAKNPEQTPIGEGPSDPSTENPEQTPIGYISIGVCSGFSRQRYRRRGARGPAGVLLYDPTRIEPKNWLTEHLGEVVLLASEGEEIEAREADLPASPSVLDGPTRDASGRPPEPERGGFGFGVPGAEARRFTPRRRRPVQIDTAPECIVTAPSAPPRRLPRPKRGSDLPPPDDRVVPPEPIESRESLPENDAFATAGGFYGVPMQWLDGLARMRAAPAPAGIPRARWTEIIATAGTIVERWGSQLAGLGWSAADVFGVDPHVPWQRLDCMGLIPLLGDAEVVAVTAETAVLKMRSGATQRFYRRRPALGVPLWELVQ